MTLSGLILVALLISSDALKSLNDECVDCNGNGPWWPLFKPSQIINSEFPEHRRQFNVDEASGSYEHTAPSSKEGDGYHLEWDHYGDVSRVSTAPINSVEAQYGSKEHGRSGEERMEPQAEKEELFDEDLSFKSEEGSLGSLFERGSFAPSKDRFSDDFDFSFSNEHSSNSVEFPSFRNVFGRQNKQVATSYAKFSSVFTKPRPVSPQARDLLHPVVTNQFVPNFVNPYGGQEVNPINQLQVLNGVNVTEQHFNTEQQKQDRLSQEMGLPVLQNNHYNPGVLWITHGPPLGPIARSGHFLPANPVPNPLTSFVPLDHPVYRYVKHHRGQQLSTFNPLRRQEDVRLDSRGNASHQIYPPVQVHIQNHETVVHHVVPTKSSYSDNFWKDSRKIETLVPPPIPSPATRTLYIVKRKQNHSGLSRFGRRAPNYVYIVKDKKILG